jgi:hypothetical protein
VVVGMVEVEGMEVAGVKAVSGKTCTTATGTCVRSVELAVAAVQLVYLRHFYVKGCFEVDISVDTACQFHDPWTPPAPPWPLPHLPV